MAKRLPRKRLLLLREVVVAADLDVRFKKTLKWPVRITMMMTRNHPALLRKKK